MHSLENHFNDFSLTESTLTIKLKRKGIQLQPTTMSGLVPTRQNSSSDAIITGSETVPKTLRSNKAGLTLAYSDMLFYALFIFLLINPVLVLTQSMDERAAVVKRETTTITTTLNPNSHQKNEQSNAGVGNQKKDPANLSNGKVSDHVNCTLPKYINSTLCKDNNNGMVSYFLEKMSSNSGMLFRTMYVLLAVTGIVIVYFVIKAIRLRRRRSKSRKYGIITKQGDRGDMEMEPLGDGADEDDDYTVFEMGRRK